MQKTSWLRRLALLAVVALFAAACGGEPAGEESEPAAAPESEAASEMASEMESEVVESEAPSEESEPAAGGGGGDALTFGLLLPETGDLAFLGPPEIQAVNFAAEEINAAGGVLGNDVEVIPGDSGSDAEGTVANQTTDRHLDAGVQAIIGAAASGISLTVIDKITSADTIMFSPANTSPEFTEYDDNDLYFRTAPTDVLQSSVQAELWASDGLANVAILARADSYGRSFANLAQEAFTEGGGSAEVISYDFAAQNFDAEIEQALDLNPDGIAIIGFEETGRLLQGLISAGAGPGDLPIYGADGNASSTLWESVDPNDPSVVEGMKFTLPGRNNEEFNNALLEFAPELEDFSYAAESYDATVIMALAAEQAGSTVATDIAAEINDVTREGEVCETYEDCLPLVQDGTDIDYDGPSGPQDFTDAGEPSIANYQILQADAEGALEFQEEIQVTLE